MAEIKGGAALGAVYWLPTPLPLETLYGGLNDPEVRELVKKRDVYQQSRNEVVAEFAAVNWLPHAEPGDLLLVCHPGPVLIGVVQYLADTDVPDPQPADMLKVTLSQNTLNWVTLGRDHRLARLAETWQNGAPLTPRAIQGVVDAARSVGSDALAGLLAPGGDNSVPDDITRFLDDANYNGSVVPILTSARARAAVLNRTEITLEDLIYGYLDPRTDEAAAQLVLRICAASPSIASILAEGWLDVQDDQPPMGVDPMAMAALQHTASTDLGLRDTSLLATLLLSASHDTADIWRRIVPGDFDTLSMAGRLARLADAGAVAEPSHVRYLRPALDAIAPDVDFDALIENLMPEETLAENAQALAEQYLYTNRAQTPPNRSDVPGTTDYIGVRNEAAAFARLIALKTTRLPLSVGVFGHWGSGKTFFLNAVEDEVRKITKNGHEDFLKNVEIVKFNAWHYMETNIWASLVDVIFRELHAAQSKAGKATDTASLFEAVRATQSDRMDALEAFASTIAKAKDAQDRVVDAAEAFAADGPRVREIITYLGEAILASHKARFEAAKAELEAAGKPVPKAPDGDTQAAAVAAYETLQMARHARSDAAPLLARMRQRIARPGTLFLLALALFVLPPAASYAFEAFGIPGLLPGLTTILTTLTLAGSMIAKGAQTGLRRLTDFTTAIEQFEATDPTLKALLKAQEQAGANLEAARSRFEVQDEAARKALDALQNETVTSRLSRLLQDRALGDVYTQHLGVIATVREDFERLSALLQQQDDIAAETTAWQTYKRQTEDRIAALEEKYADLMAEEAAQRARAVRLVKEGVARDLGDVSVPDVIADAALSREVPVTNYGAQLMAEIARIKAQLKATPVAKKPINRVMLVIDDLDRCPPKKVYEVLQAVHLFLGFPLFVAMVGVDTRWMATALREELGKLVDGENGATPQDYLEKIFQIPYWTKPIDGEGAEKLVRGILNGMEPQKTAPPARTTQADANAGATPSDETTAPPGTGEIEQGSAEDIVAPQAAVQESAGRLDMVRPTEDEKAYLAQIGAYAGATPRRIIRLTNVFMLLKATWSTRLRDDGFANQKAEDDIGYSRAVLTQLAICTGTPEWSGLYFTVLEEEANSSDGNGDVRRLSVAVMDKMRERSAPEPDLRRILGLLGVYSDVEGNRASLGLLQATAEDARTYTFAAPDALRRELSRAQQDASPNGTA